MSNAIAKASSNEFELIPEGVYTARCYQIYFIGTQENTFNGEPSKPRLKVAIFWELLDDEVKRSDGKPFTTGRTYTLSLDTKASLTADLTAWRGKSFTEAEKEGFDMENVLGTYCQVQITHKKNGEKTYANISAIMATKDRPAPVNKDVFFDIIEPDMEIYEAMNDYWKEKVEAAPEWQQPKTTPREVVDEVAETFDSKPIDLSEIPF